MVATPAFDTILLYANPTVDLDFIAFLLSHIRRTDFLERFFMTRLVITFE